MMDDIVFDTKVKVCVRPLPSTKQTKERHAFLKTKRINETWQEGRYIYRMGPNGVTAFDMDRMLDRE